MFDERQFSVGELAHGVRPNSFKHTGDVQRFTMSAAPRKNRAAVKKHRRQIETSRRHHHSWKALVAAGQSHESVETLGMHNSFHRVRNDFARHKRCAHTFMTHRDSVAHGNGAELHREASSSADTVLRSVRQPVQGHVARSDFVPARRHANLSLIPITVAHSYRSKHRPGGRPLRPVGDVG